MHDPRFDTVARWVVKPLAAVLYPAEEFAPVPEAVWMSCVTDEQLATAECGGEHNLTVWLSEAYSLYSGAQGAVPVSVREGCRGVVRETSDPTPTTPLHVSRSYTSHRLSFCTSELLNSQARSSRPKPKKKEKKGKGVCGGEPPTLKLALPLPTTHARIHMFNIETTQRDTQTNLVRI